MRSTIFSAPSRRSSEANDERLGEIERKLSADVVTEEKVARISDALDGQKRVLDRLVLKGRRPELGGLSIGAGRALEASEHKAAFDAYVRTGEISGLKRLEAKAVSTVTTPDSGYLVPPETEAEIGRRLAIVSPIRSIAGIRTVSSNVYRKPFATTGFETGWVGETDARDETDTPTLVELEYPVMELYAMPAATATLLDDTAIDIDQWIAGEVEQAFASAGRRGLRQRRRRQEAEGLSATTPRSPRRAGPGAASATSSPACPAPSPRRPRPPTCWSTRSMR